MSGSKIFEPCVVGGLSLRNRIAMAPMTREFCKDGIPDQSVVDYYQRRAKGEVGLIITEGTAIDNLHSAYSRKIPGIYTEEQMEGWKKVVDAVHSEGSAFAVQLWHAGKFSMNPIEPQTMKPEDFKQILQSFVQTSANAKKIGFDAVELHGAHGFILDGFLSPTQNPDKTLEERMTFPLQVVKAIRKEVGPDFPIIYRISQFTAESYKEIKWNNSKELKVWVEGLRDAGVNIIHISTRFGLSPAYPEEDETKTLAEWTKELSGLPVIVVGKVGIAIQYMDEGDGNIPLSDPTPFLDRINEGKGDILAVGRGLIANPNWVPLVRSGDWESLKPWNKSLEKELY